DPDVIEDGRQRGGDDDFGIGHARQLRHDERARAHDRRHEGPAARGARLDRPRDLGLVADPLHEGDGEAARRIAVGNRRAADGAVEPGGEDATFAGPARKRPASATEMSTKNQKPTARRDASSTMATMSVPMSTWDSVTGWTPSQRSVRAWTFARTYAHGTMESATPAQSHRVTRSVGERPVAGKRRKASGRRNRRWVARISRGSQTPAYAVQMWNRAAAAAQLPTAQPTGPPSVLS